MVFYDVYGQHAVAFTHFYGSTLFLLSPVPGEVGVVGALALARPRAFGGYRSGLEDISI